MMNSPKRSRWALLLLVLAGAVATGACQSDAKPAEQLPDATNVIVVRVVPVRSVAGAGQVVATGLLATEHEARLAFKIGGVIDRILVTEGQRVRRGQVLATLKLAEIAARLAQAQLGLEKARRDYVRARNLHHDSVATLEQVQNARTGLTVAQEAVNTVAFDRSFASIVAPADGLVSRKLANAGEVVAPGAPVLTVNETRGATGWVLNVGVTDAEWAAVAPGQPATVRLEAFPDRVFAATVLRKAPTADPATGSFRVELAVRVATARPAVGMFGQATLHTGREAQAVVIPYAALVQANGNEGFVYVPHGQAAVRKVAVRVQALDAQQVRLATGLRAGDEVVVANSAFLNEHSRVRFTR